MDESAIPFWFEDSLLHIGAEATAISGSWMGLDAVLKKREPRAYRHPSLDKKLTRQRLAAEARILSRLQRIDFPSPCLFDVDSEGGWILISRAALSASKTRLMTCAFCLCRRPSPA